MLRNLIIGLVILTATVLASAQAVTGVTGTQVTVSAGASRGVKIGMKAKVMAWEGMRVAFAAKLGPPPTAPSKPPPAAGAETKATAEKPSPGGVPEAVRRMKISDKIAHAKRLTDSGQYRQAVAVYELIQRELPDPLLYGDDFARAKRLLAEQEERERRAAAEHAELASIRQNLDVYRMYVDKYVELGDLAKAIEYQRTVCRVDASQSARDKLEELEYRLAVSKLPTPAYPEDIREIAAKYPERSRELQEKARQNAAVREARAAEERQRAEDARRQTEEAKRARERAVWDSFQFVTIAPGSFMMGSKEGDGDEKPVHEVRITRSFALQVTEVTQAQWVAVMGNNPSRFSGCDDCPVESVSWDDVQAFIRKLNALDPGKGYRLPTEAEWEYACQAVSTETGYGVSPKPAVTAVQAKVEAERKAAAKVAFTGSHYDNLGDIAWYSENSGGKTHPVRTKQPNAWGLYDMLGNVYECCADWYDGGYYKQFKKTPAVDPAGPASGSSRVIRGGGWHNVARFCRSANRNYYAPGYRGNDLGFRLARSLP